MFRRFPGFSSRQTRFRATSPSPASRTRGSVQGGIQGNDAALLRASASPPSDIDLPGDGERGLVSIVIPTYNRARIIGGAIESVLAQTYENVEVVVVDDGSTDDTCAVVERYDSRVRYVYQANAGVAAARNTGFAHARGEFIGLLDSDDRFLPWKLEAQVRVLRSRPDTGMIWTDMTAVSESGAVIAPTFLRTFYDAHAEARIEDVFEHLGPLGTLWPDAPTESKDAQVYAGDIFSQMLLGNLVHTSTVLLRRTRLRKVGGFDLSLVCSGEDYEFHLRTCSHGNVAFLDASSLLYRWGAPDQLTAPRLGIYRARNNLTTVLRWLDRGRDRIRLPRTTIRARLAQAFGWVGETELEYGDRRKARANLWRSFRYGPGLHRTTMLLFIALCPDGTLEAARAVKHAIESAHERVHGDPGS
jgi:glycosyltransferase involved in cell wall biosynthesis